MAPRGPLVVLVLAVYVVAVRGEGEPVEYEWDVFLSYRASLDRHNAEKLARALAEAGCTCYLDKADLEAGRWDPQLRRAIETARRVFVLVSPRWVTTRLEDDPGERRRIDDPDDVVRSEIRLALKLHEEGRLRVVPIMINGAPLLRAEHGLPDEIDGLVGLHVDWLDATNTPDEVAERTRRSLNKEDGGGRQPRRQEADPVGEHRPNAAVNLPTDPEVTFTSRPVALFDTPRGVRQLRLTGGRLVREPSGATRDIDLRHTSGVVSSDGRLALIGGRGLLQAVHLTRDRLSLLDPVELAATAVPLGIWQFGDFLRLAHNGEGDLISLSRESGFAGTWTAPSELGPPDSWTQIVHHHGGYAAIGTDGHLRLAGSLGDAFGALPLGGWIGIDLAAWSREDAVLVAAYADIDSTHLHVAICSAGRWTSIAPVPLPVVTSLAVARSATPTNDPLVLLSGEFWTRGWRLDALRSGR